MRSLVFSRKNFIELGALWSLSILWVVKHILGYNMAKYGVESLVSRFLTLGVLAFSLLSFFVFIVSKKNKESTLLFVSLCFFFLYVALVIFLEPNLRDNAGRFARKFNLSFYLFYVVYFSLGFSFAVKPKLAKIILFLWAFLLLNGLLNIDWKFFRISFEGMDQEKIGIYLFLGDSFALWSLLSMSCFFRRGYLLSFLFILSTVILFFLNSRTSLYAFFATLPVLFLMCKEVRKKFIRAFVLVGILSFFLIDWGLLMQNNSRMFALTQVSEDKSVQERQIQFKYGLDYLSNNWFWGDYGGQVRLSGSLGSYMHNYISLWRQYGLFPFLIFISFVALCVFKGFRLVFVAPVTSIEMRFFALGGTFTFVEILMARSYTSPYIWFFIGMAFSEFHHKYNIDSNNV